MGGTFAILQNITAQLEDVYLVHAQNMQLESQDKKHLDNVKARLLAKEARHESASNGPRPMNDRLSGITKQMLDATHDAKLVELNVIDSENEVESAATKLNDTQVALDAWVMQMKRLRAQTGDREQRLQTAESVLSEAEGPVECACGSVPHEPF